ncbi:hypothetical protein DSECCO2_623390 [anaerobic digester metagenome]
MVQRLLKIAAQQALAHCGFGFVNHPKQAAALLAAAHGLGQLQVSSGGGVQHHVARFVVAL